MYLCEAGDVQALAVVAGGVAGLARPGPFAVPVGEARPGEDGVGG